MEDINYIKHIIKFRHFRTAGKLNFVGVHIRREDKIEMFNENCDGKYGTSNLYSIYLSIYYMNFNYLNIYQ